VVLRITMVWSSVEYQVSETISRERSLPACPAANVRVMRVPSVCSPSMIWVPREIRSLCLLGSPGRLYRRSR